MAFISLIGPSLAFASWWNPYTWFQSKASSIVQVQQSQDISVIDLLNQKITLLEKENQELKDQLIVLNKKLSIPASDLKQKNTSVSPTFIPTVTVQTDNSLIKTEKCKAEKEISFNKMISTLQDQLKKKAEMDQIKIQSQLLSQLPSGTAQADTIASTAHDIAEKYYQDSLDKAKSMTEVYVNEKYSQCILAN